MEGGGRAWTPRRENRNVFEDLLSPQAQEQPASGLLPDAGPSGGRCFLLGTASAFPLVLRGGNEPRAPLQAKESAQGCLGSCKGENSAVCCIIFVDVKMLEACKKKKSAQATDFLV